MQSAQSRARYVTSTAWRFSIGDWMSAPEWITVRKAADLSGFNPEYVRHLIRKGRIHAEKRGGHDFWIDKHSVQVYVREMKKLGTEKHNPHRDTNGTR